MRKKSILILLLPLLFFLSCQGPPEEKGSYLFEAGSMQISLRSDGVITKLASRDGDINYLHRDSSVYLIRLRINDKMVSPESLEYKIDEQMLYFLFPDKLEVKIRVREKDEYLAFSLHNIKGNDVPDILVWGPVYTSINETIGETVGVVRNHDFAIGIQSLNPKTLGGYPWRENDVMPEMDYFDQDNYSDLKAGGIGHTLYRVEAARPVEGGSALQAYCRRRYDTRNIPNLGYTNYTAMPYKDNGLIGSAIAIFGCQPADVLHHIMMVEIGEGLPHPKVDGQWSKTAPGASAAYMIMDFSEADIQKAIGYTVKAGLRYLYHSGPFESWGHFELKKASFPDGRESIKRCVEKAKENGIFLGIHTLSNFITTNDAYVSPVPDKRLAVVGSASLTKSIAKNAIKIIIDDPSYFNQFKNNHLKAFRIEDEIIRYAAVSETKPWTLIDCQRGAFGTEAASHLAGDTVFKLADHAYKVFLSNPELSLEIADNIAKLFNETGLRQISFDGLEGNRSTGLGNYGEILFTTQWYKKLNRKIRSHYIADASRSSHYFWHIFTRMNWGEPWYAGFRESQTEYRLKNQKYFDRNYIPNMLGWFLMKPGTSIEDIEWLLARSAAFDAGYAFVTSYDALEKNGYTDDILASIALWEDARMNAVFNDDQKALMEDVNNEFHLEKLCKDSMLLSRVFPFRIEHKNMQRQPGEPLSSTMEIINNGHQQPIHFIISASKCDVVNPWLEINGSMKTIIPVKLNAGEYLKYDGYFARVYTADWNLKKSISLDKNKLLIAPGTHTIETGCDFVGLEGAMKIEIRLSGEAEKIGRR
jgi:hypothetical protein